MLIEPVPPDQFLCTRSFTCYNKKCDDMYVLDDVLCTSLSLKHVLFCSSNLLNYVLISHIKVKQNTL